MIVEPSLSQLAESDGFKPQRAGRSGLQMRVDLGGPLARRLTVRADARLSPSAVLEIGQVPDLATQISAHAAHAKRRRASHDRAPFREGCRCKPAAFGWSQETQQPAWQGFASRGRSV